MRRACWLLAPALLVGALLLALGRGGPEGRAARGHERQADPALRERTRGPETDQPSTPATGAARPAATAAITVEVVDAAGRGVPGLTVRVASGKRIVATARTGACGVARFPGRGERRLLVWLGDGDESTFLAYLHPFEGETHVRYALGASVPVALEVLVDGGPRLPPGWRLTGCRVTDVAATNTSGGLCGVIHPLAGEKTARLDLVVPGYEPGAVEFRLDPPPGPLRIELVSLVRVRFEGFDPFGPPLHLVRVGKDRITSIPMAGERLVRPGDYEIRLDLVNLTLAGFRLEPGERERSIPARFPGAGVLEVAVALPAGFDPRLTSLHVGGDGVDARLAPRPLGGPPRNPAEFLVPVPGDRTLTLTPGHPHLAPEGEAEVSAPGALTLRMSPRPLIAFGVGNDGPGRRACLVRLYRPGERARPAFMGQALPHGGRLAIGGWTPGTWDVWLDTGFFAPRLLEGVRVGARGADLGTIAFERGSSVTVHVPGAVAGSEVTVNRVGGPALRRTAVALNGRDATLIGLPAGRYSLRHAKAGAIFDVDGVADLELDLR